MKREFLEGMGLSKENIDNIMAENGKDINSVQNELNTANTTITTLKNTVAKFDGVDIEKLKTDATTWETKYNNDISALKLNSALETALIGAKARDAKAVKPFLNMDLIKLDGDKLLGFDEQLKNVKETKTFLFEDETKPAFKTGMKQLGTEGGTDKKDEANAALRAAFGKGE